MIINKEELMELYKANVKKEDRNKVTFEDLERTLIFLFDSIGAWSIPIKKEMQEHVSFYGLHHLYKDQKYQFVRNDVEDVLHQLVFNPVIVFSIYRKHSKVSIQILDEIFLEVVNEHFELMPKPKNDE